MFERYTEGARRTIFFARYEASQIGSAYIETEHLLLGLLREDSALLRRLLPDVAYELIQKDVITHSRLEGGKKLAPSTDLPLSNESKRILPFGAEEAERLAHRHIGTEHLLLGLLREENCFAARILRERGLELSKLRLEISKLPTPWPSGRILPVRSLGNESETVEIHGERWNREYVREIVKTFRKFNWHWNRCAWKESDVVARISDGSISRDLTLAADSANFRLVVGGWKKDECLICRWEFFRSEDDTEHVSATPMARTGCARSATRSSSLPDLLDLRAARWRLLSPTWLCPDGRVARHHTSASTREPPFSLQD